MLRKIANGISNELKLDQEEIGSVPASHSMLQDNEIEVIFDLLGKKVAVLADAYQQQGDYSYTFTPGDAHTSSGVYITRFSVDNHTVSRKLVELKR